MKENKQYGVLTVIAIVSISFLEGFAASVPAPILAELSLMFPEVPVAVVSMAVTLGNIMMTVFSLVAGIVIGRFIGFRRAAIIGVSIVVAAGIAPFFIRDSFSTILVCRALACSGLGFTIAIPTSMAFRLFTGDMSQRIVGFHSGFMNAGAALSWLVSGWVATTGLHNVWLLYLVCLITLVLVIVKLPEPPKVDKSNAAMEKEEGHVTVGKVPYGVIVGILGLFALVQVSTAILSVNMSYLVFEIAPGNSASGLAGTAGFIFMVACSLTGFFYGKLRQKLGRFIIIVACISGFVGLCGIFLAKSFAVLSFFSVLVSFAYVSMFSYLGGALGTVTPKRATTTVMAIYAACGNLFMFLTPYIALGLQTAMGTGGLFQPICIVFAVLWIVVMLFAFAWYPDNPKRLAKAGE